MGNGTLTNAISRRRCKAGTHKAAMLLMDKTLHHPICHSGIMATIVVTHRNISKNIHIYIHMHIFFLTSSVVVFMIGDKPHLNPKP